MNFILRTVPWIGAAGLGGSGLGTSSGLGLEVALGVGLDDSGGGATLESSLAADFLPLPFPVGLGSTCGIGGSSNQAFDCKKKQYFNKLKIHWNLE